MRAALLSATAAMIAFSSAAFAGPTLRAPGGGAVRALVVGVDKYPNLGPSAQLSGAAADARDLSQALRSAGVETVPIIDLEATRARFVAEMDRLVDASKAGDLVIVSFAGHGMQVPEYPRWKGIEASGVNEQIAFSGYKFSGDGAREIVVNKELRAWLARLDGKGVDVLVVMDSCFGGGMSRNFDQRSAPLVVRALTGDAPESERGKFTPIKMTEKEARTNLRSLPHVTFLAGATPNAVVPETPGLDPSNARAPRGALSFFVARAIEGAASRGDDLTRESLFDFVGQNVAQATNERQIVDEEPRVADALQRTVLRFSSRSAEPQAEKPQAPNDTLGDPIRIAIVNGASDAAASIEKGAAPFVLAPSAADADLVWDAAKRDVVARGDLVSHRIDGSMLGGVIDRSWAIRAVQKLSIPRVASVRLRQPGKIYAPGDAPELVVSGVKGRFLIVFNIAADGTLQLLYPASGAATRLDADEWSERPPVVEPFGADHVVSVSSTSSPAELLQWLKQHDGRRDAAALVGRLANQATTDASLEIGTVGLYTSASRD